jgi:hypothetical protein
VATGYDPRPTQPTDLRLPGYRHSAFRWPYRPSIGRQVSASVSAERFRPNDAGSHRWRECRRSRSGRRSATTRPAVGYTADPVLACSNNGTGRDAPRYTQHGTRAPHCEPSFRTYPQPWITLHSTRSSGLLMIEGAFNSRTVANMVAALERVCRDTPLGEQHDVRKRVAEGILRCAKNGRTTLGALLQ